MSERSHTFAHLQRFTPTPAGDNITVAVHGLLELCRIQRIFRYMEERRPRRSLEPSARVIDGNNEASNSARKTSTRLPCLWRSSPANTCINYFPPLHRCLARLHAYIPSPKILYARVPATGETFWLRNFTPWLLRVGEQSLAWLLFIVMRKTSELAFFLFFLPKA